MLDRMCVSIQPDTTGTEGEPHRLMMRRGLRARRASAALAARARAGAVFSLFHAG